MEANIYFNRKQTIGSHDVKCEVMDFRRTNSGQMEVKLRMSSTWLGFPDCAPDEQWVRVGETFTIVKPIDIS